MTPDAVINYLKQHPEFFEQYSEFISTVFIPHPHGGRAVSLGERQILTLREKGRQLESKLRELIEFGEENDAIGEKLHRLTLALVGAREAESVIQSVHFHLREDFTVPHVALRLWPEPARTGQPEFEAVSAASREFAESLVHPYCCAHAMVDTAGWFGEQAPLLRSFAYIALRNGHAFGMLVMASEDAQRFYPEMGTLYLQRMGELVAAALQRHLIE